MNKKQETEIETDMLKILYQKIKESITPETETIKNNLTEIFNEWIEVKIDSGELIVIQIRGEVRTGKSTVGIATAYKINQYLQKKGLKPDATNYMWKWIFSDQTEFLRFINGNERNVALCIDEFNGLAKTGINSTTEEALLDHYSDVFAGQYLHRVSMGTDTIIDKNTTIILDTMGKDEHNGITRCKLIYRDVITKQMMTIGHIDINVKDITRNWQEKGIKNIVETKGIKNKKEKEIIEAWKEKDFYIKYQAKKYERMELLKKEGIRDIRELEFADIILECLKELQDLSKIKKVQRELIMVIVDEIIRKKKRIYSIIAKQEISTKVSAILAMNTEINTLIRKENKTEEIQQKRVFGRIIIKLKKDLENRYKEIEHLTSLYKKYANIQ